MSIWSKGKVALPYRVLSSVDRAATYGRPTRRKLPPPILLLGDFFDTLHAWEAVVQPIVRRSETCTVVLVNLPGQAGTSWPQDKVMTNQLVAKILLDFVADLVKDKVLLTDDLRLVGVGNGAHVAMCMAVVKKPCGPMLLINPFTAVSPHLGLVLRTWQSAMADLGAAAANEAAFLCMYSHLYFSDRFLASVSLADATNAALAVKNGISLAGKQAIVAGVLASDPVDAAAVPGPLIVVVAEDDTLVPPLAAKDGAFGEARPKIDDMIESAAADDGIYVECWPCGHAIGVERKADLGTLLEDFSKLQL